MTTDRDPLALPPMTATRITDSSAMPGYALTSDPAETTPSRARLLREEAIGR